MDKIDLSIDENVSSALQALAKRGANLTPAMQKIARDMASQTVENFENESSPWGVPWKKSARAIREGGLTLNDKGFLKGSIREDWGPTHAAAGPEASGKSAVYARIHQLGGTIRPKVGKALATPYGPRSAIVIPARPYLGFNDVMGQSIMSHLQSHLLDISGPGSAE